MSSKNNGSRPAAKKQPETVIQITDSVIFTSPEKEPDKNKSSDTASQLNKINQFLDDNKVILGLIVTIGTILLSGAMYLYKKGYLSYFNIGAEWNDFADKSVFYLLALPFCIFIIAAALCSILIAPYCIVKSRILKTIYLFLITIVGSIGIALLIGHSAWFWLIFAIELLLFCIALTIGDKSHAVQADHSKYERNVLIIFWFVSLFFMALPIFLEQHSVISQDTCNVLGGISVLAFLFITVEIIFYFIIKAIFFKSAQPAQSNSSSDSTEKKINCFFICVVIASAGCIIYGIGQTVAGLEKSFPIIYMSEQQEIQPPDAEAIREIRELVTVTTSAAATTAPAQANGSTTTTTPAPPTTASDVPDSAVVYVVLAENKDSYLAAMGKIEGDGAGGILRIDPDCRTVLEKGKQTTVTLTFREVTKDYVYAKEDAP